jgi:uncharacterized membrane protein YidH (DUF202 family)
VNIWSWLIIVGAVAGGVGLTLFGMGTSTLTTDSQLFNIGLVLMVGGVIALVVGWVAWKATEGSKR